MNEILLSKQQYQAMIQRLDLITGKLVTLKHKSNIEAGYIDNADMVKLFQITPRTATRWRKRGRLPYCKVGQKIYYKADVILERIRIRPNLPGETESLPPPILDPDKEEDQLVCKRCPLFILLNS